MSIENDKQRPASAVWTRLAAMFVAAGVAAGCAPDLDVQPQPTNTAQWIQLSHKVAFAPGQASLSNQAARSIDAFISRSEVAYGDRIIVKGGPVRQGSAPTGLAQQRAAVVLEYLRRHRIPARHSPGASVAISGDESAIVVGRYIAIAPDCPAWNDVLAGGDLSVEGDRFGIMLGGSGKGNRKDTPLGCVTASALGAQVADPGDLVDGGQIGPGDAQFFSRGMRRYRSDETKETESIKTDGGS